MTRPLNALVLGVGGNVSQSIMKALRLADLRLRVIATCIDASSPGLYLGDAAYISPLARSEDFMPWLLEVCRRERIDAVLSGSEIVLEALAAHGDAIRAAGAIPIVSSPEVLATGRDKLRTCRWLEERGLPFPAYAEVADERRVRELVRRCGFPLVAKPRYGKGSEGVLTLHTEEDLELVVGAEQLALRQIVGDSIAPQDLIIQEHLGDQSAEFTAGCFCDRAGELKGTIVMRRKLQAGTTVAAELGEFPEISDGAGEIARALRPFGPCNIQLRLRNGRPVAFDINPRFSGTTAVRARMGFNEVEAALRHFVCEQPVPPLMGAQGGVALRYWNELYVTAETLRALTADGRLERWPVPTVEDWGRDS